METAQSKRGPKRGPRENPRQENGRKREEGNPEGPPLRTLSSRDLAKGKPLPEFPGFAGEQGGPGTPRVIDDIRADAVRKDSQEQGEHWLALSYVTGVGPVMYLRLIAAFGSPGRVLECPTEAARRFRLSSETLHALRRPDWARATRELSWLRERQGFLLCHDHPCFPPGLAQACPPVPLLFGLGDPQLLVRRQVAVVGSRAPSAQGCRIAERIAGDLAANGVIVTSGMARGIDGAAHKGALRAGGVTIAVLGNGLGRTYPSEHRDLAERIAQTGVLLSEHSPEIPPLPEHFPRRNRIISALSAATLVVEAGLRSGSLITARHALEQGREVFAVPGSVFNPLARGCHALLRQGAALVEDATDILRELGWETASPNSELPKEVSKPKEDKATPFPEEPPGPEEKRLLEAMGWDPISADELAQRSGLPPEILSAALFALELRGCLCAQLDGRYCRLPGR